MAPLPQRAVVRFAGPSQLEELAADPLGFTHWPPDGTHQVYAGPASPAQLGGVGGTLFYLVADEDYLPASGFAWTTLGQLIVGQAIDSAPVRAALLLAYRALVPGYAGLASAIPVYVDFGTGVDMRWLRTTFRGLLDGTEQFEHHLDLGKPGDDPTTTEAAQMTLAQDLATKFVAHAGIWNQSGLDVQYTEVGVVEIVATSATDSHGAGGDATESNTTAWWMWPTGTGPAGGGETLPFEVACAVTLQTDHRGPSGRGRFYLPPFATAAMVAGGRFDNTIVGAVGAAVGAFFVAIEADHDLVPVVVSKRRLILNEVRSVSVGGVPDSQRRRRRSQPEARVAGWTHS